MGYLLHNTEESLQICQEPAALGIIEACGRNFNIGLEFEQPNCQGKDRVFHVGAKGMSQFKNKRHCGD